MTVPGISRPRRVDVVGVAQRAPGAAEVGQPERVVAVDVDVFAHVRRQAGDVFVEHRVALRAQLGQCPTIQDETQRAELVLLPVAVRCPAARGAVRR